MKVAEIHRVVTSCKKHPAIKFDIGRDTEGNTFVRFITPVDDKTLEIAGGIIKTMEEHPEKLLERLRSS